MKKLIFSGLLSVLIISLVSFKKNTIIINSIAQKDTLLFEGEKHFANMQQLTFGGDNAEAYFSFAKIVAEAIGGFLETTCKLVHPTH